MGSFLDVVVEKIESVNVTGLLPWSLVKLADHVDESIYTPTCISTFREGVMEYIANHAYVYWTVSGGSWASGPLGLNWNVTEEEFCPKKEVVSDEAKAAYEIYREFCLTMYRNVDFAEFESCYYRVNTSGSRDYSTCFYMIAKYFDPYPWIKEKLNEAVREGTRMCENNDGLDQAPVSPFKIGPSNSILGEALKKLVAKP